MKEYSISRGLRVKIPFKMKKTIIKEYEELYKEWMQWELEVLKIIEQPFNSQIQLEVYKDGEEMMSRHMILQNKTKNYLENNIVNHWFITGIDGNGIDRTDLRLKIRVKHRIQELKEMRASLNCMQTYITFLLKCIFDRIHILINILAGITGYVLKKLGF